MTIKKMTRERAAWVSVIPHLNGMWQEIDTFCDRLEDTSLTVDTIQVVGRKEVWNDMYTLANQFHTAYGTWFATAFADWDDALTELLSCIPTIVTAIENMLETNYWDAETDSMVYTDMTQAHRNSLATSIRAQLE